MRPSRKVSSQNPKPMVRQEVSSNLLLPDARRTWRLAVRPQTTSAKAKGDEEDREPTGEPQGSPRRTRPCRRAAECGDELWPSNPNPLREGASSTIARSDPAVLTL